MEFVKNHSLGNAFGMMAKADHHRVVDYASVLKRDFGLSFHKLVENEHNNRPEHLKEVVTPRIHRIRVTANRIKHQGGYTKGEEDY